MTGKDDSPLAVTRRMRTRQRISRAAQKIFLERGIVGTTINDIAKAAGLSRATIYLHFNSREAILLDQLQEQDGHLLRLYGRLRDLPVPDAASIREWLDYYIDAVRAFRGELYLFSLSNVFDSEARAFLVSQRQRIIRMLGEHYSAFDISGGPATKETAALLIMFQIEQVIAALTHADTLPDEDVALDCLAAEIASFIARN